MRAGRISLLLSAALAGAMGAGAAWAQTPTPPRLVLFECFMRFT
jgi:hypothetical protein